MRSGEIGAGRGLNQTAISVDATAAARPVRAAFDRRALAGVRVPNDVAYDDAARDYPRSKKSRARSTPSRPSYSVRRSTILGRNVSVTVKTLCQGGHAMRHTDKQHLVYARFTSTIRAQIKTLITPALIEEHRLKPLGQNSDSLERVKNFFSRPPSYGLYARIPCREWQVIRLPIRSGEPPRAVDSAVYDDERTACHAVFLHHVTDLMTPGEPA